MSIEQNYIDDTIFEVQCCLGRLIAEIADQEFIGIDCTEGKGKANLLKAIQRVLVRNRPESASPVDACRFKGYYQNKAYFYERIDTSTGNVLATYGVDSGAGGWVNNGHTSDDANAIIYHITGALDLGILDLTTDTYTEVAIDLGSLPFWFDLTYHNDYLYTVSRSGGGNLELKRFTTAGVLDSGFGIEIAGTSGDSVPTASNLIWNEPLDKFYFNCDDGLANLNRLMEFDLTAGTGTAITITGYDSGEVSELQRDRFTGKMYGIANFNELVEITVTLGAPSTAASSLLYTSSATGFSNLVSEFDSENKLYIWQADTTSCGVAGTMVVDITTGDETCIAPNNLGPIRQMVFIDCDDSEDETLTDDKCLTTDQLNDLIEKAKELCDKCCIDLIPT